MNYLKSHNLFSLLYEFIRYGLVGFIAFLFDYGTLCFFTEIIGVHYLISAFLGFTIGLSVNYYLSCRFVFSRSNVSGFLAFLIFSLIGAIGLGITEISMWICVDLLKVNYMFAKILVTGIVFLWNYIARKILVFKPSVALQEEIGDKCK